MKTYTLFLVAVLFRFSDGCTGLSNSLGEIHPRQDLDVLAGNDFSLICVLNEGKGYSADDMFFTIGNANITDIHGSDAKVERLNSTAIELTIKNASISSEKYQYWCKVQDVSGKSSAVCLRYVFVQNFPQPVSNFRCVSQNLESLTCSWLPPNNSTRTNYELFYRTVFGTPFSCPNKIRIINGLPSNCTWNLTSSPMYNPTSEKFTFTMNISNAFGNLTQSLGTIDHFAHVRPAPVYNLKDVDLKPRRLELSFETHYHLDTLQEGVIYNISFRIAGANASWQYLDTSFLPRKTTHQSPVKLNITLPHPHLHYDVSVRVRSFTADPNASYLWSENAKIQIQAPPAVPESPPNATVGSFELIESSDNKRSVIVYWQKISEYSKNGDNFRYEVAAYDSLGRPVQIPGESEVKDAYVKFPQIELEAYKFSISAVNDVGKSESVTDLIVPSTSDVTSIPYPRALAKISYDNGTYQVTWNKMEPENSVDSYTIFWCENYNDRPYHCDGLLKWRTVPVDRNMELFHFENREKIYQFAISSVLNNVSSGMRWASCTILSNNIHRQIQEFKVTSASNSSLQVNWKLECVEAAAIIESYKIKYCAVGPDYKCIGPVKVSEAKADVDTHTLQDLLPCSSYRLQISAMTSAGEGGLSDPIYNKTTEGAPSEPTKVHVLGETSSSLTVKWSEPTNISCIIQSYEVSRDLGTEFPSVHMVTESVGSSTMNFMFYNLDGYTNYSITIKACSLSGCSNSSEPVLATTLVGAPGNMSKPSVHFTSSGGIPRAGLEWDSPRPPNGPIPHYRVRVVPYTTHRTFSQNIYEVGPANSKDMEMILCKEDPESYYYNISVQAYNLLEDCIIDENCSLSGDWSEEVSQECVGGNYIGTTVLIVVSSIVAFGIFIVAVILSAAWVKSKYEESRSIAIEFPWGPSIPTLGKPPKDPKAEGRGVRENSSQSSMKPLFQRINSDLSFTHIPESQIIGKDIEKGRELESSHSSVNSSGCSSAHDSVKSSHSGHTRSRGSSDSGAFVRGSFGRSSKEKAVTRAKHSELERSSSLGKTTPSYIQIAAVLPATLPEGYSRLGVTDTQVTSSPDLFAQETSGYVPYPNPCQASPSPSSHSTNSESSLLKDSYTVRPKGSKNDLTSQDLEMVETVYRVTPVMNKSNKPPKGYVAVSAIDDRKSIVEAISPGYVQVGLEASTGYVPAPVFKSGSEQIPRPDYVQLGSNPDKNIIFKDPTSSSPGYAHPPLALEQKGQLKFPFLDSLAPGYVQVGLDNGPKSEVPDNFQAPEVKPSCGYVTLEAAQLGWSSS